MIRNYLKIAFRSFRRQNLALGMACCIVLFLFIQHEWSFDRFHEHADRIHRVLLRSDYDGEVRHHPTVAAPLAPAWRQEFAGIEKAVRFGKNSFLVKYRDKRFYEQIFFADPEVFEVFSFPLAEGDPRSALSSPDSLLISERMREKYFGSDDPLGQTLVLDEQPYRVTGVLRDIPSNSHLQFDFLGSFAPYERAYADKWGVSNFATYLLLRDDFSFEDYELRMPGLVEKHRGRETRYTYGVTYPLEPLTRIHLFSQAPWDMGPAGNIQHLYIFSAVTLFILLIACFNTINLSTARSMTRAREIGLRKVVGAGRGQLAQQFLGESFSLTAVSLLLTLILVEAFLPVFNRLSGKFLEVDYLHNPALAAFLAGVFLFVGFFSGSVMTFYVSGFQPVRILKGMFEGTRVPLFRKVVIVGQFAVSILFIASTLIISGQLRYMRTKQLGYTREHVISIPIYDSEVYESREAFKAELLRNPDVLHVSASSFSPGRTIWYQSYWYEGMPEDMNPMIRWIAVDFDLLETLELNLVSGRDFSPEFPTDIAGAYILNEAAVNSIGWGDPLGKRMEVVEEGPVIGVIRDFHFQSLHHSIEPLALCVWPEGYENFLVRVRPGRIPETLASIRGVWERFSPGQAFTYSFLDEAYDNLYRTEMQLGRIFANVTGISLFIACLGLFGLASFSTERRIKEIGIRKVLGASVPSVVFLLSGEFTRWVLAANLIAWPAAYWIMQGWLERFAYHTRPGLPVFLLSGVGALLVALLTVSCQSVRAARADPVESLRHE
jgi:putative ABC transport system permease protein